MKFALNYERDSMILSRFISEFHFIFSRNWILSSVRTGLISPRKTVVQCCQFVQNSHRSAGILGARGSFHRKAFRNVNLWELCKIYINVLFNYALFESKRRVFDIHTTLLTYPFVGIHCKA